QDPGAVAGGQTHPGLADIDPQQHAVLRPRRRGRPGRAHPPRPASTWASAAGAFDGSCPPPWARSSLPPPPPPRTWAAVLTRAPAFSPRPRAASLVATTTAGRPPWAPVRATTTGRS